MVWVKDVSPTGPAGGADGLKKNDVIFVVNGFHIEDSSELVNTIEQTAPGTNITLDIGRDGTMRKVSLIVGTRPTSLPNDSNSPLK
jgi:S1-C subfamily serine protease